VDPALDDEKTDVQCSKDRWVQEERQRERLDYEELHRVNHDLWVGPEPVDRHGDENGGHHVSDAGRA
jgi:hypothetical protein